MSLPATVQFNTVALTIHDHHGQPWLAAADLARALSYANPRAVTGLYSKHRAEFTDDMTTVLETSTASGMPFQLRIFSPRGCHLIAMLARTPAAAAFRRWVLDVLEGLARPAPSSAAKVDERLTLRDALIATQRLAIDLQQRLLDATPAQPSQVTDDPATPVWATVAALTAAGCRVNHARAANWLALNLPELRALAQTHGQPLPGRLELYRLLLRSPRWLASNRAVNSAVDGRVRKCWLFTA